MKALEKLLARRSDGDLFHYTTQAGLLGIVTHSEIWATHVRYLNDASEFSHAVTLASDLAKLMFDKEKSESRRKLVGDLIQGIPRAGINVCVGSFSENGNLLSQWRAYCGGTSGYSIGFAPDDVREAIQGSKWILVPCVYGEEEQREMMIAILEETLEENASKNAQDEDAWVLPGGNITYYLNRYAPIFKNKNFEEEQEWRLISPPLMSTLERFAYREGNSTIIPYYRFPLAMGKNGSPKLKRIYIGPTLHPELAQGAIVSLLASKHYRMSGPEVPVDLSLIPYRANW